MSDAKDLFSVSSSIDDICTMLEELDLLMTVLDNAVEEGYQPEGKIVEWKAVHFVKRLPMRQALLRVIQREFEQCISELGGVSSQLMEMHAAQKEAAV